MIIVSGSKSLNLSKDIAKSLLLPLTIANIKKFEDKELYVQINDDIYQQDIVIIQSTCKPANDTLMELLLLVNAAKEAGARNIIAVLPYFGYARQDHSIEKGEAISAKLIANMLKIAGVNKIVTLDLHSEKIEKFFNILIQNLNALELFYPYMSNLDDLVIVSPDIGGRARAQKFSEKLNCDLAIVNKVRTAPGECQAIELTGNVKEKNCIIIDDIIDTANTICSATELLFEQQAKSVQAFVTHPVFSKNAINLIKNSKLNKLYITDSIAHKNLPDKIKIISVNKLFENAIRSFI